MATSVNNAHAVGLMGGTFDPIHIGHLRMALEAREALGLAQVRLLPCHRPPHRDQPSVTSVERARMLQLALQDCPELVLDERELRRDGPSYTVETLIEVRRELGADTPLYWLLGTDAFAGLDRWHRWRELLDHAHLVVIERPDAPLPTRGPVADLLAERRRPLAQAATTPAGAIVTLRLRLLPISATEIRAQIAAGESARFLLPDPVWHYIEQNHLYARA
ncbi:nicotinate-nucleotide adenylyltransferase [Marinimicrobium alkaliphilum]|uniref:nicotinate-nucleotide adenylyltransferase n=1 Tax=Marinimicrobium alkaliphilum TaxID=2202654 RepID=UPI000DB909D2|nr:nicotinate-nucleotide adenylyltransferase [Marinimicrobium alkaliphilum]